MYKIIRIKLTIHPPNQCGKVVQAINDKNQQQKNKHKDKQNNEEIKVVHKWTMFSSLTHKCMASNSIGFSPIVQKAHHKATNKPINETLPSYLSTYT